MIDTTITMGNLIQTVGLLIVAVVFYFRRDAGVTKLLENHDVRIGVNEEDIKETKGDIRHLRNTKQDKK